MMKWKLGAALAMSAALLAACSDDDDDITDPEPGVASVRVVHAAGAAPAVLNVDVGDQSGATNVMFGNAAERFDVEEGDWTFSVISPEGEAPVTLFDTTRTLVEDERLSFFIVGETDAFSSMILADDQSPPEAGNFRVRVIHASPGAGEVDVYITEPGAELADAVAVLENAAYGEVATPAEMAAGSYQVRIVASGTEDVLVDLGTMDLGVDAIRSLVITDPQVAGSAPAHAFVLADN